MTTGYTTVTAASYGGPLPVTSLEVPDDGTDIIAGDVRNYETAFLAEVKDIRTNATTGLANKLNRTGDTSTGLQTFAAGATVSSGQSLGMNGANITGTVGFSALGEVLLYGRKAWFRGRTALSDADHTVGVDSGDRFDLPSNPAAPRIITLAHTSPAADIGETLTFFWNPGTAGGGGTQYTFRRADTTVIATFVGAQVADTGSVCAEFEYTAGGWRLGQHSGTPNEYVPPTPGPESWDSYGVVPGVGA